MFASSTYQRGIGLIEVLISISISILILSGVVQLYASSRNNSSISDGQSVIQDNLRYVMSQLENDAGQAGSLGCFSHAFRQDGNYVGDILVTDNTTSSGGNLSRYDVSKFIDGTNNTGTLNTDTILFRYASNAAGIPVHQYEPLGDDSDEIVLDLSTAVARERFEEIDQYDVLLAADCSGAVYFMVTNNPTNTPGTQETIQFLSGVTAPSGHSNEGQGNRLLSTATIARLEDEGSATDHTDTVKIGAWGGTKGGGKYGTRPYVYSTSASRSVVYSIGTSQTGTDLSQTCTADTPEYCALQRDGVDIAEGIEAFQIEYGWHVNGAENGSLRFGNASQVPTNQWNNIDRIQVSITLNSVTPIAADGGSQLVRRSYVRTIALRNQIGE